LNTVTLKVLPELITYSPSSTTGVIYFDFGIYQFPETGWNDYVIVVLCWWMSALSGFIANNNKSEELQFMDGPLLILITKQENEMCKIDCAEDDVSSGVEFSGIYPLTEVINTVFFAAKAVVKTCLGNGWDSPDIQNLKGLIDNFNTTSCE
jgi:hypothetical protein